MEKSGEFCRKKYLQLYILRFLTTFGMTPWWLYKETQKGEAAAVSKAYILYHKVHKENSQSSQYPDNQPVFFVSLSVKLCVLCG